MQNRTDDRNETSRRLSRREAMLAGGAGVAGVALAGAPAAGARTIGRRPRRGHASAEVTDVAATIEVLTTIFTTIGLQKLSLPAAAVDTVGAASREELDHYRVLTREFGGRAQTHRIWVPDAPLASPTAFFSALVVGEQICVNLYLVATTIWAREGDEFLARAGAELTGCEGVHRAAARQALGLQPNDRAFMKYDQPEPAAGPGQGMPGFTDPRGAIEQFTAAGFGFDTQGPTAGAFYDFDVVRRQTPDPSFVNTPVPA